MRVESINPFVSATLDVFKTMLGTTLARGPLGLKNEHTPMHEVSGLSGQYRGMVVLSVGRETAIRAAGIMLGTELHAVNGDVVDAIGELTNMIAGAAETQLEEFRLTIGLPTVISGKNQSIAFPSETSLLVIPFDSDIGPVCIQVGLVAATV